MLNKNKLVVQASCPVRVSQRKGVRRMTLRYNAQRKEFTLTLPKRCSQRQAQTFVSDKEEWMRSVFEQAQTESIPLVFGAVIPVLGRSYRIVAEGDHAPFAEDKQEDKEAEDVLFILATEKRCAEVVTKRLKHILREYVTARAADYAHNLGLQETAITRISLRDTASRWGSCSCSGALSFSWRLVFAPLEVLDYVIAHEVAHLQEHNHSPDFWALVEHNFSEYSQPQEWLQVHGKRLFLYG